MLAMLDWSAGRWVTLIAYVLALGASVLAYRRTGRWGWLFVSAAMAGLGLFRGLGMDNVVANMGRDLARSEGLWAGRHPLQIAVFALLVLLTLAMVAACVRLWDRPGISGRLALCATAALLAFAAIRSISWHPIDRILSTQIAGLQVNWIIEVPLVVLVALSALGSAARRPTSKS